MNEDAHSKELGLGDHQFGRRYHCGRDIMLSGDTGAKLHLCHCSTEIVKMVRYANGANESNNKYARIISLTSDDIHKSASHRSGEKNLRLMQMRIQTF